MKASTSPKFPTVAWGDERAEFFATPPPRRPAPFAALVFPFYGDRVVLADIDGRGWCIPSGRIEAGERQTAATRREAREEAGVTLGKLLPLGHYRLTHTQTGAVRHALVFVAAVTGLSEIPDGSESRGRQLFAAEDIAGAYFAWDPLLAAVFAFAWERQARDLRPGFPMPST